MYHKFAIFSLITAKTTPRHLITSHAHQQSLLFLLLLLHLIKTRFPKVMAGDSPVEFFSSRSVVVLNCGNIASWSKIKKKALLTSTGEVNSLGANLLLLLFF